MADGNSEQGICSEVKSSALKVPEIKNPLKVVEKIFGFLAGLFFGNSEQKTQSQTVLELPPVKEKIEEIDAKLNKDNGKIKKEKPGAFAAVQKLTGRVPSIETAPQPQKQG